MTKKIRFPLEMDEGVKVGTLEELRENFSMERTLAYLYDGRLIKWLRSRYFDNLADEIEGLDTSHSNLIKKLCEILDVEYDPSFDVDTEEVEERNRRLKILKQYTYESKYDEFIDDIAFSQDDLYDLLDEGRTTIYLCGERFTLPISKEGMTYIGINKPIAVIESREEVDWEKRNISLSNIVFDSKYEKILNSRPKDEVKAGANIGAYHANTYVNFMLSKEDKASSENLYNKIVDILNN